MVTLASGRVSSPESFGILHTYVNVPNTEVQPGAVVPSGTTYSKAIASPSKQPKLIQALVLPVLVGTPQGFDGGAVGVGVGVGVPEGVVQVPLIEEAGLHIMPLKESHAPVPLTLLPAQSVHCTLTSSSSPQPKPPHTPANEYDTSTHEVGAGVGVGPVGVAVGVGVAPLVQLYPTKLPTFFSMSAELILHRKLSVKLISMQRSYSCCA